MNLLFWIAMNTNISFLFLISPMNKGISHLEEQAQMIYQGGALGSIKNPDERRCWPRRAGTTEPEREGASAKAAWRCVSFKQEAHKEQKWDLDRV